MVNWSQFSYQGGGSFYGKLIDKLNMGFGYSVDFVQFLPFTQDKFFSVVRSKISPPQPKFLKSWQTILTCRQLSDVDDRNVFVVNNFIASADRPQSFIELHKTISHHYHFFNFKETYRYSLVHNLTDILFWSKLSW